MKQNIAVIAGGDSGEYDISIKSGTLVAEMLDPENFNSYLIQIKGSDWFYELEDKRYQIDKNNFSLSIGEEKINFDCVFCAIHGTPGEDGKLPAYFEMLKIPYTSSNSLVSALSFNKNYCNRVVSSFGISVAKSMHLFKGKDHSEEEILEKLSLPVFVKPNAGGSSVGMSKVNEASELHQAISLAFREDDEILIEEFIQGRELTCAAMIYKNELITLPITEIVSKNEFFDFEAKYNPKLADEIVPAKISVNQEEKIKQTTALVYEKLNCRGIVRADYIWSDTKDGLHFIEINTVPGLTRESIVPKMAAKMGISLTKLFSMTLEEAMARD